MGMYWNRFLLRNDYAFDAIIEEVARDVAIAIRNEDPTTPYHAARAAMAQRILSGRDEVVEAFYRILKDKAVRTPDFLTKAFENAKPGEDGITRPLAGDIPDAMLQAGVQTVWNETTILAWPTVVEDSQEGQEDNPE